MSAFLLDTSALLAHFFDEPGGREAARLMAEGEVILAAVTRVEMHGRPRHVGVPPAERETVLDQYMGMASRVVDIDEQVARRACVLREASPHRIPTVDAMIAACASVHGAILVHRNAHYRGLPEGMVTQVDLIP